MEYQIPADLMSRLIGGVDVDYLDPLADAEGGKQYEGQWIAAMQPVSLPESRMLKAEISELPDAVNLDSTQSELTEGSEVEETDLLVLVQYRLQKVISPVAAMRSALLWEVSFAVVSILFVTLTLWWIVRRFSMPSVHSEVSSAAPDGMIETVKAR